MDVFWEQYVLENIEPWLLISTENFNLSYADVKNMTKLEMQEALAARNYIIKQRKKNEPKPKK